MLTNSVAPEPEVSSQHLQQTALTMLQKLMKCCSISNRLNQQQHQWHHSPINEPWPLLGFFP
jgi:hypothetical protein